MRGGASTETPPVYSQRQKYSLSMALDAAGPLARGIAPTSPCARRRLQDGEGGFVFSPVFERPERVRADRSPMRSGESGLLPPRAVRFQACRYWSSVTTLRDGHTNCPVFVSWRRVRSGGLFWRWPLLLRACALGRQSCGGRGLLDFGSPRWRGVIPQKTNKKKQEGMLRGGIELGLRTI